ncbi:MAG TPA: hypothetical protein VMA96_07315 [Solirubrobacteraceae bacterium]|nr:hypothetical protein [Solirubrobacteraceae bacterium]
MSRTRRHQRGPQVAFTQSLEQSLTGIGEHGDRPCVIVSGQSEKGDGPYVSDRGGSELGELSIARAEVTRVVNEPGVLQLLLDLRCPRGQQPARKLRAPAHRIDHEVRVQLLAGVGAHAAHVRHAVVPVHDELADRDAAPHVDPGLVLRGETQDLLKDGPTCGDRLESLISVAWCPVRDRRRHHADQIEPQPAGVLDGPDYVRKFLLENDPAARLQVVRLMKLGDSVARPLIPRVLHRQRCRLSVALQHRHIVAVATQHQRRRRPADPSSQHDDP